MSTLAPAHSATFNSSSQPLQTRQIGFRLEETVLTTELEALDVLPHPITAILSNSPAGLCLSLPLAKEAKCQFQSSPTASG